MSGLELALPESTLAGFLMALARTAGFVLTAPPFNTRSVPGRVKAALAVALALPLTVWTAPVAPPLTSVDLALQAVLHVVSGAALGFLVLVAVATVQIIGDIIDVIGGFTMTMALDPLLMVQTSVMGRLHQLLAITLLFAGEGHLMVLHGLARGVQLMPVPALDVAQVAEAVARDVAMMFASAVQVAGPVIAVMVIADVSLGLLTRAAPALNAFALSFPLKLILSLLLIALVVVQVPDTLIRAVETAVIGMLGLVGAG